MPSNRSSKVRCPQASFEQTNRRTHTDSVITSVRTTSMTSRQPVPLVSTDGWAQLGHSAARWRPATWTTGRSPARSIVRNTFMSRRPRRRLIPSATALAPLLDSWKNRSLGAGAAQVGDALHPKRTPLQPLFTERAKTSPDLRFRFRAPPSVTGHF